MKYMATAQLNRFAADPQRAIEWAEASYDAMIEDAAQRILTRSRLRPIVLLSGPSGSGKTTTALRIERYLDTQGHETHTLSMDNYYYRRADGVMPLDDEGQIDLESPLCIDIELLQKHLKMLLECKSIEVPTFDFANQRRGERVVPMRRGEGEIVVVEGIHALNPQVSGLDFSKWATGLYISVRTRVKDDNGYVMHPSRIRLLRRLIRDKRSRGQSLSETIGRLRSVGRGERLYIMPYKSNADIELDTFCPYELSVYRGLLLDELERLDPEFLEDNELSDLLPMLRQMKPMADEGIPHRALIREFIGKGIVK